jgi:hypothetical protein
MRETEVSLFVMIYVITSQHTSYMSKDRMMIQRTTNGITNELRLKLSVVGLLFISMVRERGLH